VIPIDRTRTDGLLDFVEAVDQHLLSGRTSLPSKVSDCGPRHQAGAARNIFVVLEGLLVALDEGRIVGALSPGDVFGEMEFLLENKRSFDVDAVTEGTRILCLSEGTLRAMISEDASAAAKLLVNVSGCSASDSSRPMHGERIDEQPLVDFGRFTRSSRHFARSIVQFATVQMASRASEQLWTRHWS